MRCSSLKSSGVKISAGVRSSIRKLPPLMISFCPITAAITKPFFVAQFAKLRIRANANWQFALQSLKYSRSPHAATDAHRHHAITTIASFQFAQNRRGQLRSSAPKRMTKRDRAAIHIDLVRIELEHLDHCK